MTYFAYKLHKGERKSYTQPNAQFQRIVSKENKKALFSEQCRKIEENNRMVKIGGDWITHKWHYFFKRKSIKKGQLRHPLSVCGSFSMAMARLLGATEKQKKKNCWEPKLSDYHLVRVWKALVVFQLPILLKSLCPRVLRTFSGNTRSHLKILFEMGYS